MVVRITKVLKNACGFYKNTKKTLKMDKAAAIVLQIDGLDTVCKQKVHLDARPKKACRKLLRFVFFTLIFFYTTVIHWSYWTRPIRAVGV